MASMQWSMSVECTDGYASDETAFKSFSWRSKDAAATCAMEQMPSAEARNARGNNTWLDMAWMETSWSEGESEEGDWSDHATFSSESSTIAPEENSPVKMDYTLLELDQSDLQLLRPPRFRKLRSFKSYKPQIVNDDIAQDNIDEFGPRNRYTDEDNQCERV
jgi:hypothetical protein